KGAPAPSELLPGGDEGPLPKRGPRDPAGGRGGGCAMSGPTRAPLRLRAAEALGKDLGRGIARLDPADIRRLGAEIGDIVSITGRRRSVARIMPSYPDARG